MPKRRSERTGQTHDVTVYETSDDRTFGIECSCGFRQVAFHGQPNVDWIIDLHFQRVGVVNWAPRMLA